MKIGILTYHMSLNCGAELQAWALQTYLQKSGYDAEIVNYGKIGWPCKYYLRTDSLKHFVGSFYNGFFTFMRTFVIESYRQHLYRQFQHDCMHLGQTVKREDVPELDFTHLITGSDQVWHPIINEGDSLYFLNGIPEGARRISYAPSFGVDRFAPELEKKMSEWLSRFDALSVREPEGAAIVKRLCGREASVVCDPTLLLNRQDYERIMRKPRFGLPAHYIAVYTIGGHPWAECCAKQLSDRTGLPVVHLPGGQFARWYAHHKGLWHITALGPAEWLWFMSHADYVITNSFHGTVFSLVFQRPFWVALNGKASDARMKALLSNSCAMSRMCSRSDDVHVEESVDWNAVAMHLNSLAETGKDFLAKAMGGN